MTLSAACTPTGVNLDLTSASGTIFLSQSNLNGARSGSVSGTAVIDAVPPDINDGGTFEAYDGAPHTMNGSYLIFSNGQAGCLAQASVTLS